MNGELYLDYLSCFTGCSVFMLGSGLYSLPHHQWNKLHQQQYGQQQSVWFGFYVNSGNKKVFGR